MFKTSRFAACLLIVLSAVSVAMADGSITGTITDSSTASPIQGVFVDIFNTSGVLVSSAGPTDVSGVYTSASRPSGTYYAVTRNTAAYIEKLYNNMTCTLQGCTITSGTPIVITAGNVTANFALTLGGTVSGVYTEEATGNFLQGRHVHVHTHQGMVGISNLSDVNGAWTSGSGIPPGEYQMVAHTFDEYITEFYDSFLCANYVCDHHSIGTPVQITAGQNTGGINFSIVKMDFEDRFQDNVLPLWTLKGTWAEANGLFSSTAEKKSTAFATPQFNACGTNYTAETYMATSGNMIPGVKNKLVFFAWYKDNKNNLQILMDEESNKWIFKHKVNGSTMAKQKFLANIDPFTFYHIRFHYDGSQFFIYLNGDLIMTLNAAPFNATGTVGYQVKAATGYFDSIGAYPETYPTP